MNKQFLQIFSQNVRKNKILTDIILETQKNTSNIIFIQELSRYLICYIPSHTNPEGDPIYGTPSHPEWSLFEHKNSDQENYPRVITYINKQLAWL